MFIKSKPLPKIKSEFRTKNNHISKKKDFFIDEENISYSNKTLKKPKRKSLLKTILFSLLFIIIAGLVVAYFWGDAIISKITGGKSGLIDFATTVISEKPIRLQETEDKVTNILFFGTSGYNMGGSGHDGAHLTDSIMLISLKQDEGKVVMLSIPRDLRVLPEACSVGKINEVFSCGAKGKGEEAGREYLGKVIEKVTGQPIHYYVHINWGALVSIVDSVGGIEVVLDEDVNDPMTNIRIRKGVKTILDGERALGLARSRTGVSNSDYSRGFNQQHLILAIINKVKSKGLGFNEVFNILNSLGDNIRISFGAKEIKAILKMNDKFDVNNISQLKLSDPSKNLYLTGGKLIEVPWLKKFIWFEIPTAGEGDFSEIKDLVTKALKPKVEEIKDQEDKNTTPR